jgi:hypothetical protein
MRVTSKGSGSGSTWHIVVARQHFLNFRPLPHGHDSLGPILRRDNLSSLEAGYAGFSAASPDRLDPD